MTLQPQSISGSTSVHWSHYQLCPGQWAGGGGGCLIRRPLGAWHVDAGDPQWLTEPPKGAKVTSLVQPVLLLHEVYKHL